MNTSQLGCFINMTVNAHEVSPATESVGVLHANASNDDMLEKIVSDHKPSKNPVIRILWVIFGSAAVVLATIGAFLPGWPTVSWLVFAGYAYGRSSQRLFRWLLTNKLFGESLLNYYKNGRALPLHSKIVIIGMIIIVSIASIITISKAGDPGYGQATIGLIAIIGIGWVGWKVPTME